MDREIKRERALEEMRSKSTAAEGGEDVVQRAYEGIVGSVILCLDRLGPIPAFRQRHVWGLREVKPSISTGCFKGGPESASAPEGGADTVVAWLQSESIPRGFGLLVPPSVKNEYLMSVEGLPPRLCSLLKADIEEAPLDRGSPESLDQWIHGRVRDLSDWMGLCVLELDPDLVRWIELNGYFQALPELGLLLFVCMATSSERGRLTLSSRLAFHLNARLDSLHPRSRVPDVAGNISIVLVPGASRTAQRTRKRGRGATSPT